ncbi:hypothetical protein B0H16DRAFT_1586849 [Mycena metata]|uniref:Secreted protein n=1 Tax=Mycena metata TaxID=1033252 RepID=A0AAD7MS05_9AGAR|nr:hypothetical protein B0H16DRAFT_1586849 [Mycena metata]
MYAFASHFLSISFYASSLAISAPPPVLLLSPLRNTIAADVLTRSTRGAQRCLLPARSLASGILARLGCHYTP